MDEKIKMAEIPHDKEDYVNIKRLLLGYVYKIIETMEDEYVDK